MKIDLFDTLDTLRTIEEVISHLFIAHPVAVLGPQFPVGQPPSHEQRERALKTFVQLKVRTLLAKECPGLAADGMYPTEVILAAVVDSLLNLSDQEKRAAARSSYDPRDLWEEVDPLTGEWLQKNRFTEFIHDPNYRRSLEQHLSQEGNAFLDWREIPVAQLSAKELMEREYIAWIESALWQLEERVQVPPYFRKGKLQVEVLPAHITKMLAPIRSAIADSMDEAIESQRILATRTRPLRQSEKEQKKALEELACAFDRWAGSEEGLKSKSKVKEFMARVGDKLLVTRSVKFSPATISKSLSRANRKKLITAGRSKR